MFVSFEIVLPFKSSVKVLDTWRVFSTTILSVSLTISASPEIALTNCSSVETSIAVTTLMFNLTFATASWFVM